MIVDYVHSLYYLKLRLMFYSFFPEYGFSLSEREKEKNGKKKKDKSNGENALALQCGKLKKQSTTEMKLCLVGREE